MSSSADRRRPVAFWPTPTQERVLRIIYGPEGEARRAWTALRSRLDLDDLEPGTFALMPLLYRRLESWRTSDRLLDRLKGLYRHTWSHNQLLLASIRLLATTLEERSVDFLVAGGPLLLRFYGDPGLRPTDRVDLIVRAENMPRAADVLQRAEWRATDSDALGELEQRGSVWFTDAKGSFVVLHRSGNREWDDHAVLTLDGLECPALSASGQLMRTCSGDGRHYRWGRVQWVPDVHALARSGEIEWAKIAGSRLALGYAREVTSAPIPVNATSGGFPARAWRLALRGR